MMLILCSLLFAGPLERAAEKRQADAQAQVYAAVDQAMLANVRASRAEAEADPADVRRTLTWLGAVHAAVQSGTLGRGGLAYEPDVVDVLAAAERGAAARPDRAAELLATGAEVLALVGKPDEAAAMAERSLAARSNKSALMTLLDHQRRADPAKVPETCATARAAAKDDTERFDVLDECFKRSGFARVEDGLAWASVDDRGFYLGEIARYVRGVADREFDRALEEEERRLARAAEAEQARAETAAGSSSSGSSSSGSSGAGTPTPAGPVYVSAHVTCRENVRVFHGSATGSGTYGWESPNSRRSYTLRPGDQLCVCDGSDRRQSCWTAPTGGRVDLEITCGGLSAR